MAYIGNTVTSVPFITDSFSGNASTTSFSPLTRAPAGTASIAVFVNGVYQAPGSAYTLSGTTINFTSPPASGVGNIIVLHLGNGSTTQVTSDGSVTLTKLSSDTFGYINAAFTAANTPSYTANSAASYANAAFATANTGSASGSYANSGFAVANSAASYANSAFSVANNGVGIDATQNTNITAASSYANSAFATANTGSASGSYANSAFSTANTASTNATNAGGYANSAFAKANTAGTGTVTSVSGTNGLTGTVTTSGSLSLDVYTGSAVNNTSYPIGTVVLMRTNSPYAGIAINTTKTVWSARSSGCSSSTYQFNYASVGGDSAALSGTWKMRGQWADSSSDGFGIVQRIS